jgi:hypothetical protein
MLLLSIPVLASIAISIAIIYKFIIYPTFISPLSKIPNAHWSSSISPFWILWSRYNCQENRRVHAAHLQHGSVVRLAPNELSVNDVGGLRTVYAAGFEKGQWYSIFDNYGFVVSLVSRLWRLTNPQRSLHVLLVALSNPFSKKANDLEHLLQI